MTEDVWRRPHRFKRPMPSMPPLISQAEMVARIQEARAEAGPLCCPTCGSTTPEPIVERWCAGCQQFLARSCFTRDRAQPGGLDYRCKLCAAADSKANRSRLTAGRGQIPLWRVS